MIRFKTFIVRHPYYSIILGVLLSRIITVSLWPLYQHLFQIFQYQVSEDTWISEESYIGRWLAFDSEHYLSIAKEGYRPQTTAFFPLYPLLIRFFSSLPFLNEEISGLIISNLAFLLAMIVFYKLLKKESIDPFYPIILLLFSPITIFFFSIYTESLFLLFTVTAFYFIRSKKWCFSLLIIGMAALTRNSGFLLILLFSFEFIKNKGWEEVKIVKLLPYVLFSLISIVVYPYYLLQEYGNPTLYVRIQDVFWNRHFQFPWQTLWHDILNAINNPLIYLVVIFNLFFFLLAIWSVVSKDRLPTIYIIFVLFSIFMPLMYPIVSENLPWTHSLNRYVLALFPLYMFLGLKIKHFLFKAIFLEIWLGLYVLFTTAFLGKQFIG